jgi:hypothetical protein
MEPQGSLPSSQDPLTGSYLETDGRQMPKTAPSLSKKKKKKKKKKTWTAIKETTR